MQYWIGGLLALGLAVLVFVKLRGACLRVSPHSVPIDRLPDGLRGLRIAVISDLHDRTFGPENRRLVRALREQAPDVILLAGDMHEAPADPTPFFALVSALSEQCPVLFTEGNHELRGIGTAEYTAYLEALRQHGAVVLNDASYTLERNGARLVFCGLSWEASQTNPTPDLPSDAPCVLAVHDPNCFDRLSARPDLTVSGHIHGGILRLPFLGPVFAPGNGTPLRKRIGRQFFFPKYSRGLYRSGPHTLAVSQGLGFAILPLRFIRPEILLLTLEPRKK